MPRKGVVITLTVSGGKNGKRGGEDVIAGRGGSVSFIPFIFWPVKARHNIQEDIGLFLDNSISRCYLLSSMPLSSGSLPHQSRCP